MAKFGFYGRLGVSRPYKSSRRTTVSPETPTEDGNNKPALHPTYAWLALLLWLLVASLLTLVILWYWWV